MDDLHRLKFFLVNLPIMARKFVETAYVLRNLTSLPIVSVKTFITRLKQNE